MNRSRILVILSLLVGTAARGAQSGGVVFYGSVRSRVELWNWFEAAADSGYGFSGNLLRAGFRQQRDGWDWNLELAAPVLLGLPANAIAPAPQGLLGLGANYYAEARGKRNAAMAFPKQASITWRPGDSGRHRLELGRFEFAEGAELAPKNPALAALKNTRIRERLIGTFGFTHVQRSFDGAHYSYDARGGRLTVVGAAPTRGVFQTDGWGWAGVGFGYVCWTQPVDRSGVGEWRLFGIYYDDWRQVAKTDNRPLAARSADREHVRIGSFGGHWVHIFPSRAGNLDGLVWAVAQTGRWGRLDHAAWALAAEGGWQPKAPARLRPWLRGGAFLSSGDAEPGDGRHQTFFQMLPTPRIYARFPFYNLMNLQDFFGSLILRPHGRITFRTDVRSLRLSRSTDLWYAGGGAYNPWSFGVAGRPSRGGRGLATLFDLSADVNVSSSLTLSAYYSHARGKSVIQTIYPNGSIANMGYLELTWRF